MAILLLFVGMVLGIYLDRKSRGMIGDFLSGVKGKLKNMLS